MNKACGHQTPVFAADRERAIVAAPANQLLTAELEAACDHHSDVHRNVDGHQSCRGGGKKQTSHGHSPAGAAGGYTGAMVAQDRRDSFFIYGKSSAAFQAIWHVGNRITKEVKIQLSDPGIAAGWHAFPWIG